jgi:hypothetical protein
LIAVSCLSIGRNTAGTEVPSQIGLCWNFATDEHISGVSGGRLTSPRLGKSHEQGVAASVSWELDLSSPDSQYGIRLAVSWLQLMRLALAVEEKAEVVCGILCHSLCVSPNVVVWVTQPAGAIQTQNGPYVLQM